MREDKYPQQAPVSVVTKAELDKMEYCGHCHEKHKDAWLNQRCHPKSGLEAHYVIGSGMLEIRCFTCKAPVVVIQVAERFNSET